MQTSYKHLSSPSFRKLSIFLAPSCVTLITAMLFKGRRQVFLTATWCIVSVIALLIRKCGRQRNYWRPELELGGWKETGQWVQDKWRKGWEPRTCHVFEYEGRKGKGKIPSWLLEISWLEECCCLYQNKKERQE